MFYPFPQANKTLGAHSLNVCCNNIQFLLKTDFYLLLGAILRGTEMLPASKYCFTLFTLMDFLLFILHDATNNLTENIQRNKH